MTRGQKYYRENRERLLPLNREYNRKNRTRLRARQRERYRTDPEFVARRRAYNVDYAKRNRKHLAASANARRKANIDAVRKAYRKAEAKRRSTPEGMSKVFLYAARTRCKEKGWKLEICPADVLAVWPKDNRCPVFGTQFEFGRRKQETRGRGPSLDRIDSTKGYVKGNIAVISWWANNLKGAATPAELRALADWTSKNT